MYVINVEDVFDLNYPFNDLLGTPWRCAPSEFLGVEPLGSDPPWRSCVLRGPVDNWAHHGGAPRVIFWEKSSHIQAKPKTLKAVRPPMGWSRHTHLLCFLGGGIRKGAPPHGRARRLCAMRGQVQEQPEHAITARSE